MDWWLITFFLGALLSLFFSTVPTLFYIVCVLVFTLLVLLSKRSRKWGGVLLGFCWMWLHAMHYQYQVSNVVPQAFSHKTAVVTGTIDNIAQVNNDSQRFNFVISSVNNMVLKDNIRVRLSWKKSQYFVKHQQRWQLAIRIKPAHGLANTGGFSYQTWLRKNNIAATGYVVKSPQNILLSDSQSYRQRWFNQLQKRLPNHELSPLITALTFGERGGLTATHWQVIQHTSTQHLIAISGLHLGLVATLSYLIFSWFMAIAPISRFVAKITPDKLVVTNNRFLVITLSLLLTLIYAYIAGFSIPTIRALIMISLFWLSKLSAVKISVTRWLLLSICIIVVLFPFSLFSMSFWLSFYAVAIIFTLLWRFNSMFTNARSSNGTVTSFFNKVKRWAIKLVFLQVSLVVLMWPITTLMTQKLSLVAIPANLIAVPWMSITTIPLSLLATILIPISDVAAQFVMNLALSSMQVLWWWLTYLSALPNSLMAISAQAAMVLSAIIVIGFLYVVVEIPIKRLAAIGISFVLPIICYEYLTKSSNEWRINVMDVGQGLSVLVESNDQVLIYDTGARYPSGFSMAETVIGPYLRSQGYDQIDYLVISHDDNDHSGGLSYLQQNFVIQHLIYNKEKDSSHCIMGKQLKWQFLMVDMLWPTEEQSAENDDSCVIKISDGRHSVLLTGDISKSTEAQLVSINKEKLNSTYLIVPHHGSTTSSSRQFLDKVSPEQALISAGFQNRWRMPVASVLNRYQVAGIPTINTAESGMIRIDINKKQAIVSTYRDNLWPFWFAN